MNPVYLIDGYNLLYALGMLHGRVGPLRLERARGRLLDFLHGAHPLDADSVTVVFDAAVAPPGTTPEHSYHGLHVCFAVNYQEADDMIEELIHDASVPNRLHVVSDDHRIQRAARRRQCQVLGCADYLDRLEMRRRARPEEKPQRPEKADGLSEAEARQWLDEFADLAGDPEWKELFEPYDFEDGAGG